MIEMISTTIILALYSCFAILLIGTTGIRDRIIISAPKVISKLFSCDFCLSWWICFLCSIACALVCRDTSYILCSIAATPITRIML